MSILRNSLNKCKFGKFLEFNLRKTFIREYAKKKHNRSQSATVRALNHFDDFYKGLFKNKWNSIRLGLLSDSKHVALLNNFGEIDKTKELLKNEGALDLKILLTSEESYTEDEHFDENESNQTHKDVIKAKIDEEKEVLKALYPEGSTKKFDKFFENYNIEEETSESDEETYEEEHVSLHEALGQSQIDTSRLIDPDLGLDSSSLHEYVPISELKGKEDYIPEGDYYRFYKVNSEIDINIEAQNELPFPEHLNIYSFPRGDMSRFSKPKVCTNNVLNYYLLDGGSVLPVLALGLEPNDVVLDLCAAPGGKSMTILQTMLPRLTVCNDKSLSRCNRLKNVFHQYLLEYPNIWKDSVIITNMDGENYPKEFDFNKILVDAPCTTDRISASVEENNIFKTSRTKERLRLPELQTSLLESALRMVEPGGTVVYSTCTLSPIQNDGVVNVALQNVWRAHGIEFTVIDLMPAVSKMKDFYKFDKQFKMKYGVLIVPFIPVNFGPMYVCKLIKN